MAQLALSLAGAAVGFALGGPTGAQIGWAAGSLLGAGLGPGQQGPRLSDTKVQVSSYGAALGIVYGAYRKAGNVIWSTDLVEHESEEGGKGGPSITTYSYSVSCAVAICEGVKGGVRRIWADAKLVYDAREGADGVTQAATSKFASYMKFYPGSETQMPDPTIEADRGAGNVPAYRGTCYMVFTDLPLQDYGNRIPNFTFEVTDEEVTTTAGELLAPLVLGPWEVVDGIPQHSIGLTRYTTIDLTGSGVTPYDGYSLADAVAALGDGYTTYLGFATYSSPVLTIFGQGTDAFNGLGAKEILLAFNKGAPDNVIWQGNSEPPNGGGSGCSSFAAYGIPVNDGASWLFSGVGDGFDGANATNGLGGYLKLISGNSPPDDGYELHNNCINYPPVGGTFPTLWRRSNRFIVATRELTLRQKTCYPNAEARDGIFEAPGNPDVCITSGGQVLPNANFVEIDDITPEYRQLQLYSEGDGFVTKYPVGPVLHQSDPRFNSQAYWEAAAAAAGIVGTYGVDFPKSTGHVAKGTYFVDSAPDGSVPLSTIVSDLCLRTPLQDGQIDVTELTDNVLGYGVGSQMPARNALAPLAQAFFFDVVETGALLRFVKRGSGTAADLSRDEIGAGEDNAADSNAEHTRAQETELPTVVNVAYAAVDADYQTGTQTARRRVSSSEQAMSVELPLVLTDQQAADIAAVLLYDVWTSRTQRAVSVMRNWSHLEPTDVIEFSDQQFSYRIRVADVENDGPVIKLLGFDTDPAAYAPEAVPSPTPGGGDNMTFVGPTRLEVLDIPLLREADDSYGVYAAAAGYLRGWAGARVFRSTDDGVTFTVVRDVTRQATMGRAQTSLGNYLGGNTVDELNEVTVTLNSGELASTTRALLLNNANAAVLADEVLQFQRAELVTGTTYRLTGLLRGRLGTERAMGQHKVGDRFVLLDEAGLYRLADALSMRNNEQVYKAVTFGLSLEDASPVDATNRGTSQMPLSPVHLKVYRQVDGTFKAEWIRRTRYDGSWLPGVDVPLGEATEAYLVEVLDGENVVLSETVNTPSVLLGSVGTSLRLEALDTLSYPIWMGREVSGDFYGLVVRNVADDPKRVVKIAANGLVTEGPAMGSQVFQAVHGDDRLYVITTNPLLPTLWSFRYADMSVVDQSRTSAVASDFGGVAYDGQFVWLAERSTNNLYKLNPTTLATVDTYSFTWSGSNPIPLYADRFSDPSPCIWALVNNDIVKWSLTTNSEVGRVTTGCTDLADIVLTPNLVFALDAGSQARVEVYDRATLTLQAVHAVGAYAPVYPGHYGRVLGDQVFIGDIERVVNVFNANSGALIGRAGVNLVPRDIAGVYRGALVVSGSPTSNYLNIVSSRYELVSPNTVQDFNGKTLRISQVSALVGPGFSTQVQINAGAGSLTPSFSLQDAAGIHIQPAGTGFIGIDNNNLRNQRSIHVWNNVGQRIGYGAIPPVPAKATEVLVVGASVFVSMINGTEPSRIYKFALADITPGAVLSASATYEAPAGGDLQSMVYDGGFIFASRAYSGGIVKLSPADLTVQATYTATAGARALAYDPVEDALYVVNGTDDVVSVRNADTGATLRTFSVQRAPSSAVYAQGLLYVASGVGIAYDATTGAQVRELGVISGDANGKSSATAFVRIGDYVAYADPNNQQVVLLYAASALQALTLPVADLAEVSGAAGNRLFVNTKSGGAEPLTRSFLLQ